MAKTDRIQQAIGTIRLFVAGKTTAAAAAESLKGLKPLELDIVSTGTRISLLKLEQLQASDQLFT